MKKIILACTIFALYSCGKSSEEKAQELIKTNLKESLNDWSSYESVSFSKLDSIFSEYKDTPDAAKLEMEISKLQRESDSIRALANSAEKYNKDLFNEALSKIKKAQELDSIYNINKESYKGNFNGWQMIHKYRGNNSYGSKEIATSVFYLDTNLARITEQLPLN